MRNVSGIAILVVALVMAVGCGSGNTPTGNRTNASSPLPSSVPTETPVACGATSTPCLVLVTLRGSDQPVVRDISDISHPKTVGGSSFQARFISATEVAYIEALRLFRAPISGGARNMVDTGSGGVVAFVVSPDGGSVVYLMYTNQQNAEVHLLQASKDRLLGGAPGLPDMAVSVPCTSQTCVDRSDYPVTYSPDGGLIMWNHNSGSAFRVWTAAGVDVTPALGAPLMPVWTGSSLYFQDSKGIEVFRDGAVKPFLPGVSWIKPKASPLGGQIVYESRDSTGLAHTYVVDTSSGAVRELGIGRSEPVFLTSRFIWNQGERLCTASESCDPATPVKATGKTYIYDLQDGTESTSLITKVLDVWPHAA